jgi:hypothetical protein
MYPQFCTYLGPSLGSPLYPPYHPHLISFGPSPGHLTRLLSCIYILNCYILCSYRIIYSLINTPYITSLSGSHSYEPGKNHHVDLAKLVVCLLHQHCVLPVDLIPHFTEFHPELVSDEREVYHMEQFSGRRGRELLTRHKDVIFRQHCGDDPQPLFSRG